MLSNHPSVLGSGPASVTTSAATSAALDLISSTQGAVLYRNATVWTALTPGTAGQLLSTQGAAANPIWVTATGGAGDFNGPASSTDNAIVRFDGTGGKTGQNSAITVGDAGSNLVLLSSPSTNNLQLQGSGTIGTGFVQVINTTPATTSTSGSFGVGDRSTAAANVGIGGGNINAGGTLVVGGIAGIGASTTTGIGLSQGGDPGTFTFSAANAWVGGRFAPERAATTGNAFAVSGQIRLASGTQTSGATFIADVPNGTVTNHTYFYANGSASRVAPSGTFAFYSDAAAGALYVGSITEATIGGAGSLTTAGGIYAAKKIVANTDIIAGGTLTIGNTVSVVSPTSPNRTITMVVGGVTLYIAAKTTND